ncbi:hypothetical protein J3D46_000741 [Paenarthrobacter sp. A20]|nr:hypothetical protein [Paenarthrobacter sp. A20]
MPSVAACRSGFRSKVGGGGTQWEASHRLRLDGGTRVSAAVELSRAGGERAFPETVPAVRERPVEAVVRWEGVTR